MSLSQNSTDSIKLDAVSAEIETTDLFLWATMHPLEAWQWWLILSLITYCAGKSIIFIHIYIIKQSDIYTDYILWNACLFPFIDKSCSVLQAGNHTQLQPIWQVVFLGPQSVSFPSTSQVPPGLSQYHRKKYFLGMSWEMGILYVCSMLWIPRVRGVMRTGTLQSSVQSSIQIPCEYINEWLSVIKRDFIIIALNAYLMCFTSFWA